MRRVISAGAILRDKDGATTHSAPPRGRHNGKLNKSLWRRSPAGRGRQLTGERKRPRAPAAGRDKMIKSIRGESAEKAMDRARRSIELGRGCTCMAGARPSLVLVCARQVRQEGGATGRVLSRAGSGLAASGAESEARLEPALGRWIPENPRTASLAGGGGHT
jgi:hypothetical protein